ncbi:glutamate [NMDA] receptor-associated protein 1-like protein [Tribonema minus]|uniref:Glutamate [NMDA] receptor-associated protein 1-like protein n=1 Tax=Tribonema minus TaxID=303371 RepID=A0A835ZEZ5_9STRA|nr:glutamate [NMDA] receptor-associated protein 1-like protein [Tribonema minus]
MPVLRPEDLGPDGNPIRADNGKPAVANPGAPDAYAYGYPQQLEAPYKEYANQAYAGTYTQGDIESGTVPPQNTAAAAGLDPAIARKIRHGFLRKVYCILMLQLALTCGVCAVFMFVDPVRNYMLDNWWPFWVAFIVGLVLLCGMFAKRKSHPANLVLLTAFTLTQSVIVGTTCAAFASYDAGQSVVTALFITMAVFGALTLFTLQTKIDFSFMGAGLGCALLMLLLWGLIAAIFGLKGGFVYALIGSIIFSLYILYHTSVIMHKLPPDEYILAVIMLYLDFLNLFQFILMAGSSR